MKLKIALATLALSLTPALALAWCPDLKVSASNCLSFQIWDEAAGKCVPKPAT